jgi:alpha-1,2-mannosyltransferase
LAGFSIAIAFAYLLTLGRRYGLDLMVYRDAIRSWESGNNPYQGTFTNRRLAFTYPPSALVILSPLGWLPFSLTQIFLWIASISAAVGAVALVIRETGLQLTRSRWCLAIGWSCISILVLEPVRSDMDYGQVELLLMFLVVADILLVPRRFRGILIGLTAAVKLTPLVFIVYLAAARDLRSAGRAIASFFCCTALAWAFWPAESLHYWLHDILQPSRIGITTFAGNQSWYAVISRLSLPGSATTLIWILLSLATVVVGSFVVWRAIEAGRVASAMFATALIGLLVSPISWTHHWVWVLLIAPLMLGYQAVSDRPLVRRLLGCILVVTCAAPYWWLQRGAAADALDALLPICAAAVLAVSAADEWMAWRAEARTSRAAPEPAFQTQASTG